MAEDVKNIQNKIFSGIFWQGGGEFLSRGIQFVLSIILARLIAPEDFGVLALVTVFISFCGAFVDGGFANALIQKKDAQRIDFDSVFWFNLFMAVSLYGIIFLGAPWVAAYYQKPIITILLRVTGLKIIIGSLNYVQDAILCKRMLFRIKFNINFLTLLLSGLVGLVAAFCDLKVWALSLQLLTHSASAALLYWILIGYRPQLRVSLQSLKCMFCFGYPLFIASFLDTFYSNLISIIIGKKYNVDNLAFYNRGNAYPLLVANTINSITLTVLFPAFSALQDNPDAIRKLAAKLMRMQGFLLIPALGILFVGGKEITEIILGAKWLPCVIFMQIALLGQIFTPYDVLNRQIFKACGLSKLVLKIEVMKKIFGIMILLIAIRYGLLTIAWSVVVSNILFFLVNAFYSQRLIGWGALSQIRQIIPGGALAILVLGGAYLLSSTFSSQYIRLSIILCFTGIIYALVCFWWLKRHHIFENTLSVKEKIAKILDEI